MPIHSKITRLIAGLCLGLVAGSALADDKLASTDPNFGNRTDKSDGSSAMTIGRRLPSVWDTKVGTDVSLAAPDSTVTTDHLLRGADERSHGAVWGSLALPGLRPLGFDKTSIDARLDAGSDKGKFGATLSRSLPIGQDVSLTLQNSYSVTQSLATNAALPGPLPSSTSPAASAVPPGLGASSAAAWAADETLRFDIAPSGTTFSAGAGSSTADMQWHNKFSIEQTLYGPLKLTTSVENAGSVASNKSITAGFKRTW